ncbi:MAG: histidine phosphatase family protein [Gemmatimonadota bacterium]
MELYLIRHAQSYNNSLDTSEGRQCDPPLTEIGERQADLVGQYLASGAAKCPVTRESPLDGFGLDRLYCSAHRRCLLTADRIGAHTGLAPEIWVEVHEEMGIYLAGVEVLPGMTPAEIRAQFPRVKIPADMPGDGWWNRPVETRPEWEARAARVARRLTGEMAHTDERIAVVTHGGFTRDLLAALINGGPLQGGTFAVQNTSIGRIDLSREGILVRYLNRVEHLPPHLVT